MPQTPRSKQKLFLTLASLTSTVTDSFPLLTLLYVPVGYAHDAPPAVAAHKVRAAGVVEQGQRGVDGGPEGHLEGSRNERACFEKSTGEKKGRKSAILANWTNRRERGRRKKSGPKIGSASASASALAGGKSCNERSVSVLLSRCFLRAAAAATGLGRTGVVPHTKFAQPRPREQGRKKVLFSGTGGGNRMSHLSVEVMN